MTLRLAVTFLLAAWSLAAGDRPNILWIVFEDLSPELGCYGDPYAVTPHIDRLARQSAGYTKAFSNAGSCAPARSTLITGMYPPAIGTHHMRSEGLPPPFVKGFPEYLQQAGYHTSNHAKQDYNWIAPDSTWNANNNDWRENGWRLRGDKPFFTVINITETHSSQVYQPWIDWESRRASLEPDQRHDPAKAIVPPYYPDTPETREVLKRYADNVTYADRIVGDVLEQLEADGLAEETIVFFYADHGTGLPRSKSFQFESSLRVPLMVRFPRKYQQMAPVAAGGRVERLVAFIDFAPTVLSLAGVEIPEHFQGAPFLGAARQGFPKQFVYGYRDRMDERYELIRSVRDGRFKYIRNYFPHLPWFHHQTRLYPSTNPLLEAWHRLSRAGALAGPAAVYMAMTKPREQVFDVREDPNEMHNLADDPSYAGVLTKLRRAHRDWVRDVMDLGFLPEEEMWLRFGGRAYEAVRADPEQYPLERILAAADLVGTGAQSVPKLTEMLADADPTVRYWAAVGLTAQGPAARPAREALRQALDDERPSVRAAAAQALCEAGDCERGLQVLVEQLRSDQEYISLRAANALQHLGERARPALPEMRRFLGDSAALEPRVFFSTTPWASKVLIQAIRDLEKDASGDPRR